MSDPGAADDDTPAVTIQPPDISPDITISPDDPTYQAPDRGSGIGNALGDASLAVKGVHGAIGGTFGLADKLKILSGDTAALRGLKTVTRAITAPLDFGAGTAKDIHNGADPGEAVLGNGIRAGLVLGAGILGDAIPVIGPVAGPAAGWAANRYLPDGAAIGHAIVQSTPPPQDFPLF